MLKHVRDRPESRPETFWSVVFFPLFAATTLLVMDQTSAVGINLWRIEEPISGIVVYAYISILLASIVWQNQPLLHQIGTALGVVTFGGRAGGFLDLVLAGNVTLWGAVFERGLLILASVQWHNRMSWRSTLLRADLHPKSERSLNVEHISSTTGSN